MIDTSNKEIQSHYDYIVVGAGAAGSVLAAELSASGAQVLVIESGGPDDAPTIANPSIWFYNVGALDTGAVVTAIISLTVVALIACCVPARRPKPFRFL